MEIIQNYEDILEDTELTFEVNIHKYVYTSFAHFLLKIIKLNHQEEDKEDIQKLSRQSSSFKRGINDILEVASNLLAEASMKIQDEIDSRKEKLKGEVEYIEMFELTKSNRLC